MFNLGWGEILLIGIVALIAIGPKELPGVLRTVGQALAKVRRMANEFQGQFQEALRLKPDYAEARNNLVVALAARAEAPPPAGAATNR